MQSKWVTIASFNMPYQAHLAKTRLEAADIPVTIRDEHLISINQLYSPALGGVKIQMLGENLKEAREILDRIRPHLQGNQNDKLFLEKLAWLPAGAEVLNAEAKMAGYLLVYDNTPIFFLPGIPAQMKELFIDHVLPCLAGWSADDRNHIRQRVYRTFGTTENMINKNLQHLENNTKIKVGYYPVDSEVHISLTVFGQSQDESDILFGQTDAEIIKILGDKIYGFNKESMAAVIGHLLQEKGLQLSVAESCTGGLLASKITEVAGSSQWFVGGITAYSNQLKEKLLAVDNRLIAEYGAVSVPVARAMAKGASVCTGSQISVSVTGIAGPTGGSDDKPVGTVFFGVSVNDEVTDHHFTFSGNRREIQEITAQTALDLVRQALMRT